MIHDPPADFVTAIFAQQVRPFVPSYVYEKNDLIKGWFEECLLQQYHFWGSVVELFSMMEILIIKTDIGWNISRTGSAVFSSDTGYIQFVIDILCRELKIYFGSI